MFEKRYLVLEDGSHYTGFKLGSDKLTRGEIVFNTAMTGYQETISDPHIQAKSLHLRIL